VILTPHKTPNRLWPIDRHSSIITRDDTNHINYPTRQELDKIRLDIWPEYVTVI